MPFANHLVVCLIACFCIFESGLLNRLFEFRIVSRYYMVSMNFFSFSFLQVFIVFGSSGYLFVCLFVFFSFSFLFRSPDFQSVVVS